MTEKRQGGAGSLTVRIGGEAGQGMNVMSKLIGRSLLRRGLSVFINHDIMSRIRGGHNFSQIRLGSGPLDCPSAEVDVLVCLDGNTLELYKDEIGGIVVFDSDKVKGEGPSGDRYLPVPMQQIADEKGGDARMANSVASGAVFHILGMDIGGLADILGETFSSKGKVTVEGNVRCARAGFDFARENFKGKVIGVTGAEGGPERMLVTGSEAMALGALASDLRFFSAYPMSPATAIMEFLASVQTDYGLVVEQAEDEISAVNMVIGASFAGARSMVATSGGGMALMVEGISLAAMTETPLVIIDCQRPAPATGLPTRTEQGDLLFAAHCAHGEFPRVILAPADAGEAFHHTGRAIYLAEKYQLPVFILGDQFLNDSSWTVESFDHGMPGGGRFGIMSGEEAGRMDEYSYRRYETDESGITTRILPGTAGQVLYADSDEHTAEGHITESGEVRTGMVRKRLSKTAALRGEMAPPRIYPDSDRGLYALSWGSTLGAVDEAVQSLRSDDIDIGYIHFSEICPMRDDVIPERIRENSRLISVENNATGQLARLLRMEAGIEVAGHVGKFDGRPFSPRELAADIEETRGKINGR